MELIIDRGFMDNFFLAYNENDAYHEDIKQFYKKIKGWKIITNYESEKEFILEAENSNPFLHWFIETNVPEIEFRKDLLTELKSEGYYSKGSPFKLVFCDSETHSEKHGFLTIKSDDISGRRGLYESIIKGLKFPEPREPLSFNVLLRELNALGLETELIKEDKDE